MANGIGGIMANYLIDTNIFFELLCGLAGKENINKKSDLDKLAEGELYISEITRVEIFSVIGKYARGEQEQWQICARIKDESGTKCMNKYYNPGRKKWKKAQIRDMRKLVNNILDGESRLLKVQVLKVTEGVLQEARRFINYAFTYKFASLDAVIAGTAKYYSDKNLILVTYDKSLRTALYKDGGQIWYEPDIIVEGVCLSN